VSLQIRIDSWNHPPWQPPRLSLHCQPSRHVPNRPSRFLWLNSSRSLLATGFHRHATSSPSYEPAQSVATLASSSAICAWPPLKTPEKHLQWSAKSCLPSWLVCRQLKLHLWLRGVLLLRIRQQQHYRGHPFGDRRSWGIRRWRKDRPRGRNCRQGKELGFSRDKDHCRFSVF